ncbi:MAG: NUDIX hydrolase [Deltaproteobacteria bacterium]|nr:NUDIX hydrolase [Deltaproteobacteria bacterium]
MRREYPEAPIMGVGGIVFQGESVLLGKRAKEPGKGSWTLPGGAVELGETLEDAVKRELLEEASITIRIGGLARLLERIVRDEAGRVRYHYIIADYWAWRVSGELRPGSDISDARFVPLNGMHGMGLAREVVETILTAARMRNLRPGPSSGPHNSCQG